MKGYIYLIYNEVNNDLYVGLTEISIKHRFNQHTTEAKKDKETKNLLYNNMRQVGINECKITCLQEYNYDGNDKDYFRMNLKKLEDKWIIRIKPSLNTAIPCGFHNEKETAKLNQLIENVKDQLTIPKVFDDKWKFLNDTFDIQVGMKNVLYKNKKTDEITEYKVGDIVYLAEGWTNGYNIISGIRSNSISCRRIKEDKTVNTNSSSYIKFFEFINCIEKKIEPEN